MGDGLTRLRWKRLVGLCLWLAGAGALACSAPKAAAPSALPTALDEQASTSSGATPTPPVAPERAHEVKSPQGSRSDPYYWLRDDARKDADVLGYLTRENEYAAAVMAPAKGLEETLFAEMRGRIQEDDVSVPVYDDGYYYYTRYTTGKQQPIHARRKGSLDAPEEVLLDGNELGRGLAFYRIGAYAVSRDGKRLAWAEDRVGRNQYVLRVKEVESGQLLEDTAENIAPSVVWSNDGKSLFYVGKDETTLREDRIFRRTLGGSTELVFHESDGSYYVSLASTKSRRYIRIQLDSTLTSERRLIDADRPLEAPRVFLPRERDHLYELDHLDGRFVLLTNRNAKNFRLVTLKEGERPDPARFVDLLPHRPDVLIESFALYHGAVAASVRSGGLRKVQLLVQGKAPRFLDAPEPTYAMSVIDTPDADSLSVRYGYDSLTTPNSVFEVDLAGGEPRLLKRQPVPGYDPAKYETAYLHATASDGAQVPVSVVSAKTTPLDGRAPLLVYGYGSYGISSDPRFDNGVVSLLDRGWVYAIAHVRGGQELGRAWYEDGKLEHKKNTFTDFVAATEHLIAEKRGARDQVFAMGASAGGLLMGAVLNARPDLYRGVAARVPFVDVVTTMLDESVPLTTNEFDEWGNPKQKAAYDYMLSYSPYDNVRPQAYPSIYVQTGLWDSQVQYFEPAKWVARLRATKTDLNLLVMEVDMSSGHGGASGRFDRLRQIARTLSFFLLVSDRPDARR